MRQLREEHTTVEKLQADCARLERRDCPIPEDLIDQLDSAKREVQELQELMDL